MPMSLSGALSLIRSSIQKAATDIGWLQSDLTRRAPRTFEDYLLTADCVTSTAVPTGPTGTFQLLFEDNFDGTSLGRAWLPGRGTAQLMSQLPYNNATERQGYLPSQVVVQNGNLELRAAAAAINASDEWGETVAKTYKSGMVQSCTAYSLQHGVIEARIKIPTDVGYWPSFWMIDPAQRLDAAEIDIAEWFDVGGALKPHTFAHWGDYRTGETPGQVGGVWSSAAPGSDFHTYTLEWSRVAGNLGRLTGYFDGVQAGTVEDWNIPNQPLSLVLNLAVHANATPADATMYVDYVRVWKRYPDTSPMSDTDAQRVAMARTIAAKLFPGTWNEGSTYGNWHVDYNGYGTVQQLSDGTIRMQPQWAAAGDTSACLVSSTSTYTGDVTITAQMRTIQQRPTGTNPWETAWLFWGFTTKIGTPSQGIPDPNNVIEKAYYIALKPNGWELGKLDQENFTATGGQRYLTDDTTPTYPVDGTWHQVRITMTGATITATVDGTQLATFTDGPGSAGDPAWSTNETVYTSGSVCLYCEDSLVEFRNVTVTPNGSATQTWLP